MEDGSMVVGVYRGVFFPFDDAAILHLSPDGQLLGIFLLNELLGIPTNEDSMVYAMETYPIDFYMISDGELTVLARTIEGFQVFFLTISPPQVGL